MFRARLLAVMRALGIEPHTTAPERWVVDCKAVGSRHKVMVYLGRYLYRGVVQERDILRCDGDGVTYRWRDGKTGKCAQRTVAGVECLRLVLQHVLPKGFRRARSYGLLHPNCRRGVALARTMALRRRPLRGCGFAIVRRGPAAPAGVPVLRRADAHRATTHRRCTW